MKKTAKGNPTKTLVLVDSHAILHRAYHALPPFFAPDGSPSGALYGLSSMLISMLGDIRPDFVAACYDLAAPTFRHEAYENYKAGRAQTDDDLVAQIVSSRRVYEAFGIPVYEAPGFEADDLLGTITEQLRNDPDVRVVLVTGDMDTLQLVRDPNVAVYTLRKGFQDTVTYDEDAVRERYGIEPYQLPDWKGIAGDPSDNIPGVPGIGAKGATDILRAGGTIEDVYKRLESGDEELLSAGLKPRTLKLLREHEPEARFSKELATIRRDAPIMFDLAGSSFDYGTLHSRVEGFFEEMAFKSLVPRVKNLQKKIAGPKEQESRQAPEKEQSSPAPAPIDPDALRRAAILYWLVDADRTDASAEEVLRATNTRDIAEAESKLRAEIAGTSLERVWTEIEEPLCPIIRRMEDRGILLDIAYLKTLQTELEDEVATLDARIRETAGEEININSPRQLSKLLFETLGLPHKGGKKAGGAYSTRADILDDLRDAHPIVSDILAYRELSKLLSTYITVFPTLVADDGRIHARFIQNGTTTGRFSSANPNLQNIPTRGELGMRVRQGFVAAPGHVLVGADYSQIELRVASILSGDETMQETFRRGEDVHAAVASRVFGIPPADVTNDMRRKAKVVNFGILYGMGVRALQAQLGTDKDDAAEFLRRYKEEFPKLAEYLQDTIESATKLGYTETVFGRRRPFRMLRSPLPHIRAAAERMAINAPIQGTAADLMKISMRYVDADLAAAGLSRWAHPILQVHDEIIYEVHESKESEVRAVITSAMESAWERSYLHERPAVPLSVETSSGPTWRDIS